ncbi:hypothetical protein B0T25DRAFT_74624 [Lasiosphaeria hispida]|uniref:Uncharacterized protein n=1 Tax=Lasiosphaeria hispida TaxID=260671 RepID=A0AAJ0HPF1_9PEZI|nr:hypothetical protein B0T25DRAFT_74624 [Lasiosphaeria hispida]
MAKAVAVAVAVRWQFGGSCSCSSWLRGGCDSCEDSCGLSASEFGLSLACFSSARCNETGHLKSKPLSLSALVPQPPQKLEAEGAQIRSRTAARRDLTRKAESQRRRAKALTLALEYCSPCQALTIPRCNDAICCNNSRPIPRTLADSTKDVPHGPD